MVTRGEPAPSNGSIRAKASVVNWLVWLGLAVVIAVIAAVSGVKPKGTRPVSHSRLMGAGRVALLVIVVIFAYIAFRARSGG